MTDSQSTQQRWHHHIRLALDIYAVVLILYLLLMLIPQRPWLVELISNFLLWALLPSPLIFIILLVKRKWRSVVLWTVPALAFLILFGGLFFPNFRSNHVCASEETASCRHFRVMTFNLLGGPIRNRQPQMDMLRNSGADIIALQEVNQGGIDAIEGQLADLYPYQVLFPKGVGGTGIISKFPIQDHEFFMLTTEAIYQTKAIVDVEGLPITIFSVHPRPPLSISDLRYKSRRYNEINTLVQMATEGGPVLLMGDFNLTDQSSVYRVFTSEGLYDSFREVGWGFGLTWPGRLHPPVDWFMLLMRIDYIWHTDDFLAVSAWAGPRALSDHVAVIADLIYVPD